MDSRSEEVPLCDRPWLGLQRLLNLFSAKETASRRLEDELRLLVRATHLSHWICHSRRGGDCLFEIKLEILKTRFVVTVRTTVGVVGLQPVWAVFLSALSSRLK